MNGNKKVKQGDLIKSSITQDCQCYVTIVFVNFFGIEWLLTANTCLAAVIFIITSGTIVGLIVFCGIINIISDDAVAAAAVCCDICVLVSGLFSVRITVAVSVIVNATVSTTRLMTQ